MMEKRSRRGEESYSKIDELPEEILINIIGRLSDVKEAARTSVVCQRWRNLWALSTDLNFDKDYITMGTGDRNTAEIVNRALDAHKGLTVESLRIAVGVSALNNVKPAVEGKHRLDKWVEFAIRKRVRTLELDLDDSGHDMWRIIRMGNTVRFPPHLVLDGLTSLSLTAMNIRNDDEVLRRLFPTLETLSLVEISSLTRVQVTAPRLKQLTVGNCEHMETFDLISTPNLQCFKYYNWERDVRFHSVNLSFNSAPKLSTLTLGGPLCHHNSLVKLKSIGVENLVLEMNSLCRHEHHVGCNQYLTRFPTLGKLKQLEFKFLAGHGGCSMNDLTFIIRACPNLEKLTLKYEMLDHDDVVEYNSMFEHPCLQVVEFIGWRGLEPEFQLANYLIDTCTNLREYTFDLNPLNHHDRPWRHRRGGLVIDDIQLPDVKAAESSAKQLMIRKSRTSNITYHII